MPAGTLFVASAIAWVFAVVLILLALRHPRVGALVERAILATGLALFGTVYGIIATNTDFGLGLIDPEVARTVIRSGVVLLITVPPFIWVILALTGRLGQDEAMARIEDKLDVNTAISQGVRDDAHEAAEVANTVNAKIAAAETAILAQNDDRATDRAAATIVAAQVDDIHRKVDA